MGTPDGLNDGVRVGLKDGMVVGCCVGVCVIARDGMGDGALVVGYRSAGLGKRFNTGRSAR